MPIRIGINSGIDAAELRALTGKLSEVTVDDRGSGWDSVIIDLEANDKCFKEDIVMINDERRGMMSGHCRSNCHDSGSAYEGVANAESATRPDCCSGDDR